MVAILLEDGRVRKGFDERKEYLDELVLELSALRQSVCM